MLILALVFFLPVLPLAAQQERRDLEPPAAESSQTQGEGGQGQGTGPGPSEGADDSAPVPLDQIPAAGASEDGGQGPAGVPSDFDAPPDQGGPSGDSAQQDPALQVTAAPEEAPPPKAPPRKRKRKGKKPAKAPAQDPAVEEPAASADRSGAGTQPEESAATAAKPAKSRKARVRGKAGADAAQAKAQAASKPEEASPLPATPFAPAMP